MQLEPMGSVSLVSPTVSTARPTLLVTHVCQVTSWTRTVAARPAHPHAHNAWGVAVTAVHARSTRTCTWGAVFDARHSRSTAWHARVWAIASRASTVDQLTTWTRMAGLACSVVPIANHVPISTLACSARQPTI